MEKLPSCNWGVVTVCVVCSGATELFDAEVVDAIVVVGDIVVAIVVVGVVTAVVDTVVVCASGAHVVVTVVCSFCAVAEHAENIINKAHKKQIMRNLCIIHSSFSFCLLSLLYITARFLSRQSVTG